MTHQPKPKSEFEAIPILSRVMPTLKLLRESYVQHHERGHDSLHRLIVSGFVITKNLRRSSAAMKEVLQHAKQHFGKNLREDKASYIVMLDMLDAKDRSERKTASLYGRAIEELLGLVDKSPQYAYGQLKEHGVKEVASGKPFRNHTTETKVKVKNTKVNLPLYNFICPGQLKEELRQAVKTGETVARLKFSEESDGRINIELSALKPTVQSSEHHRSSSPSRKSPPLSQRSAVQPSGPRPVNVRPHRPSDIPTLKQSALGGPRPPISSRISN